MGCTSAARENAERSCGVMAAAGRLLDRGDGGDAPAAYGEDEEACGEGGASVEEGEDEEEDEDDEDAEEDEADEDAEEAPGDRRPPGGE